MDHELEAAHQQKEVEREKLLETLTEGNSSKIFTDLLKALQKCMLCYYAKLSLTGFLMNFLMNCLNLLNMFPRG